MAKLYFHQGGFTPSKPHSTKTNQGYEVVGDPRPVLLDPVAVNRARNQLGFLLSDLRLRGRQPDGKSRQPDGSMSGRIHLGDPGAFYVWTFFPNMTVSHDVFAYDIAYLMHTPTKHVLEKIQSVLKSIGIFVYWRHLGTQPQAPFSIRKR
ncbi:hypothetical protein HK102_008326 [Quaeritorhiza haematococci]|nr:hypothetical protein HK102_008326 [Quaeritorhiza haematococci]